MGRDFYVERGVLVPRAVTEVLVRACSDVLSGREPRWILDLGCGSGMVGITLALAFPNVNVLALDIASEAVELTRRNIQKWQLESRVQAAQSDMFAAAQNLRGEVDAIVSSPPFISSTQLNKDRASLLDLEPRAAFDAGPYGIAIHQRLVKEGEAMLRPGSGWLVVEFGEGQERQVRRLIERSQVYDATREYREYGDRFVATLEAQRKPTRT